MALPLPPRPPQPIPNNPFYYPQTNYLQGDSGPFIVGGGLFIDNTTGTISAGGSGPGGITTLLAGSGIAVSSNVGGIVTVSNTGVRGLVAGNGIQIINNAGNYTIVNTAPASAPTGTVTQIIAGGGLTGGTITTSGTIALPATGVAPGTYNNPTITVDGYGRITFITPGTPSGALGVLATAPLQATTGVFPPTVSIQPASTLACGAVRLNDTVTSTCINQAATPRAVKETYDLASLASTNATSALAASSAATSTANTACTIAQTAQTCAFQALSNAAVAQGCANQGILDAATAQSIALTALANSSTALTTSNSALSSAGIRIPCSAFSSKGAILAGATAGSYCSVAPGTDGYALTACSSCVAGVTWTEVKQPYYLGCTFAACIPFGGTSNYSPNDFIGNWAALTSIPGMGNYASIVTMNGYANSAIILPTGIYSVEFNLTSCVWSGTGGPQFTVTLANAADSSKTDGVNSSTVWPPISGVAGGAVTASFNASGIIQSSPGACAFSWLYTFSGSGCCLLTTMDDEAMWKITRLS